MPAADAADAAREMSPVGADDWSDDDFFDEEGDGRDGMTRQGRETESRDLEDRDFDVDDTPWLSSMQLEAPEPLEGMVQRWIRASAFGTTDRQNLHKKARQGWTPRPLSSIPKRFMPFGIEKEQEQEDVLTVGGMILCHRSEEIHAQYAEKIRERTRFIKNSVNQQLGRVEVPSTPFSTQSKSEVTFGRRPNAVSG